MIYSKIENKKSIILLITFAALVLFLPSNNLWMGDGYNIRATIHTFPTLGYIAAKNGDFFVCPISVLLLKIFSVSLSYICGVIWGIFVWLLAKKNSKYAILFVAPIIQLFAGYWEFYAPVYMFSLIAYYFHVNKQPYRVAVFAVLAFFSHFIIGLPVIFLSVIALLKKDTITSIVIGSSSVFYIIFMITAFKREASIFKTFFGYYGMFSTAHILEMLGIFLFLFLWILIDILHQKTLKSSPVNNYLLPAFLSTVITVSIVPCLGALRDWDLLSLSFLPISFWYLELIDRISVKTIVITGIITASFMVFNCMDPQYIMNKYMNIAPQYDSRFMNNHITNVVNYIYKTQDIEGYLVK